MEKNIKKNKCIHTHISHIHIYITESLYSRNYHNIVNQLYFNLKKKKEKKTESV